MLSCHHSGAACSLTSGRCTTVLMISCAILTSVCIHHSCLLKSDMCVCRSGWMYSTCSSFACEPLGSVGRRILQVKVVTIGASLHRTHQAPFDIRAQSGVQAMCTHVRHRHAHSMQAQPKSACTAVSAGQEPWLPHVYSPPKALRSQNRL